jgi:hypothetical protein
MPHYGFFKGWALLPFTDEVLIVGYRQNVGWGGGFKKI